MKTFFNTKSIRERVLMTALLLVAVVSWGSSLLGRTHLLQGEWETTADDVAKQLNWFNNRAMVAERTAKVTAKLDPNHTLNAAEAFAEISRLAQAQGLAMEMGTQRTEPTENFTMHSFQVTIRRADFKHLGTFYLELSQKAPYLGIDQCSISSDRAAPDQYNAVFRIYSVEVARPAKP